MGVELWTIFCLASIKGKFSPKQIGIICPKETIVLVLKRQDATTQKNTLITNCYSCRQLEEKLGAWSLKDMDVFQVGWSRGRHLVKVDYGKYRNQSC